MKNLEELSYKQAHDFVQLNKKAGFYWEGYTIVKWSPGHNGYTQTNGMFKNNKWGYANKYPLTSKGTWLIPSKYVKHS
jgi:hypothetical protein